MTLVYNLSLHTCRIEPEGAVLSRTRGWPPLGLLSFDLFIPVIDVSVETILIPVETVCVEVVRPRAFLFNAKGR